MGARLTSFESYKKSVDAIYAAAYSGEWQTVTDVLAREAGDIKTQIFGHDFVLEQPAVMTTSNYSPEAVTEFEQHFGYINAWMPGIMRAPLGKATHSENYLAEDALRKTEFYGDWLRKHEDIGTGGGALLYRSPDRVLLAGANIRFKDRERLQDGWIELLDLVSPHLQTAFDLHRRLAGLTIEATAYDTLLEHVEGAIILLDHAGRVHHANRAGNHLLSRTGILTLEITGRLHLSDPHADGQLQSELRRLARAGPDSAASRFRIRAGPDRIVKAHISPFRPRIDSPMAGFMTEMPVAMLQILDPEDLRARRVDLLAGQCHLSPAETELLDGLCAGRDLNRIAAHRGVSLHTVRNQLRVLFAKTGTHSQAQLVAQVNMTTAPPPGQD